MKWHTIVSFPPDIAMHNENHFSGLLMQDCTHALLVIVMHVQLKLILGSS
jgi:hypothetical protein